MSGKMIAKGPNNQEWHRRLGHPNSHVLQVLLKSRSLGNKNLTSSKIDIVDCASCKLGKSKSLIFPLHTTHNTKPFELVHIDV